jgi:hypothetical protein
LLAKTQGGDVSTEKVTVGQTSVSSKTVRKRPSGALKSRRKFLYYFPGGFHDETYIDWERNYKWKAHQQWEELLNRNDLRRLLKQKEYSEIAARAIRIESRTNLLFSFEKMALRDAVKSPAGARLFSLGLYDFLHGSLSVNERFAGWVETIALLPRKQTRVLTWPVVTVFGFIAQPQIHMFLKPNVTRIAARKFGFDFHYKTRPSWETYSEFLQFGETVRSEVTDLRPRDMIDIQSFIWVLGSDEYDD